MTCPYLQRHVVVCVDPMVPITDEMLTTNDNVERVKIFRGRSVLPHVQIEELNPGFAAWEAGGPRGRIIVESIDGTAATARVLARGWVRDPQLSGEMITTPVECYPLEEALADAKDAAAAAYIEAEAAGYNEYKQFLVNDPSANDAPYRDALFGRMERLGDDLVENRTIHFRFNPVTHDVTVHEDREVAGVVNIGENYDPQTYRRTLKPGSVSKVKMRLQCDVQQEAAGFCDIGRLVDTAGVTSLTGYQQNLQSSLGAGYGWSMQAPVTSTQALKTPALWTGDIVRVMYRVARQRNIGTSQNPNWETYYDVPYTLDHWRYQTYDYTRTYYRKWIINYSYSQSRREYCDIVLNVPIETKDVSGIRQTLVMPTVTISDIYSIFQENYRTDNDRDPIAPLPILPYEQGRIYRAGERVTVNGDAFEALADVGVFWLVKIVGAVALTSIDPRWKNLNLRPPVFNKTAGTFFDLPRGKAAIAHALLKMRTKALDLLFDTVELQVDRDDYWQWDVGNEIRFLIPGSEFEPMRAATGRVREIVEDLSDEGDTVTLTIELGKGTGLDQQARFAFIDTYAGDDSYFPAGSDFIYRGTPFYTAGPDIEWTYDADPLVEPVEVNRLRDPLYSVLSINYSGSHVAQIQAIEAASRYSFGPIAVPVTGIQPVYQGGGAKAPTLPTTKVLPVMRSLAEQRTIKRFIRVAADLLYSPKGLEPLP